MTTKASSRWIVPVLLLILGAVAVASGVMRLSAMTDAMTNGVIPEGSEGLDHYIESPIISILHLIPGILFMLLGPLQFIPDIRQRWPKLHRWSGRIVVFSGILIGMSALSMALVFPVIVNHFSTVANITFGLALVGALLIALRAILKRDINRHRAWMMRAYAIAITPAVMRVLFGGLFVSFGEGFMDYLPILIWVTFLFNIAIAEFILRRQRLRKQDAIPHAV